MPFFLKAKKLDISTGRLPIVAFHEKEAARLGIQREDRVEVIIDGTIITAIADYSDMEVTRGQIGFFKEAWDLAKPRSGQIVEVQLTQRPPSVEAIKRKLLGKNLTYEQVFSIIQDIVTGRIGDIEVTYFIATGFIQKWKDIELYYMAKAMAETGEMVELPGIVIDIHSIGGLPGNRTTMLTAPIAACLGLVIPKTSTRAITSPSGVSDTVEVLTRVDLSIAEIKRVVKKVGACLAWGGTLNLAPADDRIIKMSYPLSMEPYSKMIVSIMAKKMAMGVNYFVIEMPIGPTAKVHSMEIARKIEKTFQYIGHRFGMKVKVVKLRAIEPTGHGIGPALEARDVLRVLQQKPNRSRTLERTAIRLVAYAAKLSGRYSFTGAYQAAQKALETGKAWQKMQQIIKEQGANIDLDIDSEKVLRSNIKKFDVHSNQTGRVLSVNNYAISDLARILGAPLDKQAGLYLNKRVGEHIEKDDLLFTMYAETAERIDLAKHAVKKCSLYEIA